MRPPGLHLCGFVALSFLVSPIHAATKSSSAKTKSQPKTAAAKTQKDSEVKEHVVKKGETLWSISQKYNTSVGEVMELNKLPKEYVRDGMKLKIPPRAGAVDPRTERRKVHVVDDEETFWSIAGEYNISPEALANANPNVNPNRLHPDMELVIPSAEAGKTAKSGMPVKPAVTLKGPEGLSLPEKTPAKPDDAKTAKKTPETGGEASPVAAAPVPASGREHVIEEGETFYGLGRKYGVSMESILAANPQVDPRRMKNGTKVIIPDKVEKPAKEPSVTAPAEGKPAGAKPAVATAAVVAKNTKPLPPIPGPNALPIPKPKVNALASEQVKKQIMAPLVEKKTPAGGASPVVIPAPSELAAAAAMAKPKSVNVNLAAVDAPPPASELGKSEEKTSDEHGPVSTKPAGKENEPAAAPVAAPPAPAPVKIATGGGNGHEAAAGKPQANTVGSDGVIRSYIVSDGESEGTICEAFGISKEQLYEYNRLPATARLKSGDEIMIPRVAKIR